MPWYLRRSVRVGPVRFNFSKSGIGTSVGTRGLRYGVRPDGRSYIHAGRYGIYFREELSSPSKQETDLRLPAGVTCPEIDVTRHETAPAKDLIPTSREDLLTQLNRSYTRPRADLIVGCVFALASIAAFNSDQRIGLAVLGMAVAATVGLARWETRKRTVAITYDLNDAERQRFQRLVEAFNFLTSCGHVWARVTSRRLATRHESKRHAGVHTLLDRAVAAVGEGQPPWVETNVSIPVLKVRGQTLYFMPDGVLLYDNTGVGLVEYGDVRLDVLQTRFVEPSPPADAEIVDQRWKHPNRDGTPDRRFKNNYRIPVCLYGELTMRSNSGLSLHLMTSQSGAPRSFAREFREAVRTP